MISAVFSDFANSPANCAIVTLTRFQTLVIAIQKRSTRAEAYPSAVLGGIDDERRGESQKLRTGGASPLYARPDLGRGQGEIKYRSPPKLASNSNFAPVQFHNRLSNG
jgi:hypothetical protein